MIVKARDLLSLNYAHGRGIEIGAFHNPFPVRSGIHMVYVDKRSYDETRRMADNDYTIGPKAALARVDVVDCGERLKLIQDNQFDFLVSSHQLEHTYSPYHAVYNHLRVVKQNACLIYALPDMRHTFDKARKVTDQDHLASHWMFEHLSSQESVIDHHDEYLQFVDKIEDSEARRIEATRRTIAGDDVHFHTWTSESMLKMFLEMQTHFVGHFTFEIEFFTRAGHENFIVIRKL